MAYQPSAICNQIIKLCIRRLFKKTYVYIPKRRLGDNIYVMNNVRRFHKTIFVKDKNAQNIGKQLFIIF